MKPGTKPQRTKQTWPRGLQLLTGLTGALASLAFACSTMASTLHVPRDYATIQAAVDAAAASGDEILIASGTYTQQVFITEKKLTLAGSPDTILQAWTGMQWQPEGPSYTLLEIRNGADVVVRNIEFDGMHLAQSMPNHNALLQAVIFFGASGRVENCAFRGFRGITRLASATTPPLGGKGFGVVAFNPVPANRSVVHVQVFNCDFADNGVSITFAGDYAHPDIDPTMLRTTFAAVGNTVTGVGPTSLDFQAGIQVLAGASGVIKNNLIIDHCNISTSGYWSEGIIASPDFAFAAAPLQALRIEGNTLLRNEKHLVLVLGDNAEIINNVFEGSETTLPADGIWLTGSNVFTSVNLFTNLSNGIVLAANDPHLGGAESGIAENTSLVANRFCILDAPITVQPGVSTVDELGTELCPWPETGSGHVTCAPAAGRAGTAVSLAGTKMKSVIAVLFNGRRAEFSSGAEPDRLVTATVPAHASTGPVTVITPEGNINSLIPFTVPVSLELSLQPDGLVQLSWIADATELLLETASDLIAPDWQPVATSPSVGTESVIWTGSVGTGAQFFRLRQP